MQIPGTVLALLVATLRFDIGLDVSWAVAPAIALVALTGASVGYALATTLRPELTNHVASFLSVAILLFSPINFPADRMPAGLRALHLILPVQYMADVVRGSLSDWVDQQKSRAKADRDQTAELLKTVDDPEFKAFYQSEVARLTRLLDGIKPGAPLVFAVVVRGVVPQLQSLASQPGVRLVDVGPSGKASGQAEYHGLRPEEVARVNDTAPRPL